MAINPPAGALIDYFLEAEARGAVVLSIRDAKGELVRRYASDDAAPEPDLAKIRSAPEWLPRPATLSKAPGLHRFVWPLQYTPAGPTKGDAAAVGVWAPPGQYSVELSADGTVLSQPLTLLPDPRVSLEPEAYARQFALARRIEAVRALVNTRGRRG